MSYAGYRADIDGLRALAVLVVIVFHLDEAWLPAGFVGVDIFFVISGYVVLASLLRKPSPSIASLLSHFYARRAKRLMPSLVVVIVCTAIMLGVAAHGQDPPSLEEFYASGLVSLIGGANIYFNLLAANANARAASATRGPTKPPLPTNATAADGGNVSVPAEEEGAGGMYFGGMAGRRRLHVDSGLASRHWVQSPASDLSGSRRLSESVAVHDLHRNPFMHMWSLGVEEQFYFLFPWVVMFAYGPRVIRRSRSASNTRVVPGPGPSAAVDPTQPATVQPKLSDNNIESSGPPPLLVLCGVSAISLAVCWWLSLNHFDYAFYLMPSRLWQLASGAILYHIEALAAPAACTAALRHPLIVAALDLGAIALLTTAFVFSDARTGLFPLPWSLLAVGGTLLFLIAGAARPMPLLPSRWEEVCPRLSRAVHLPFLNNVLGHAACAYVGKLSYPLYLWHWPVFVAFKWTCGFDVPSQKIAALAISFPLAMLSYHAIERPFRVWRSASPKVVAITMLPLLLLAALPLVVLLSSTSQQPASPGAPLLSPSAPHQPLKPPNSPPLGPPNSPPAPPPSPTLPPTPPASPPSPPSPSAPPSSPPPPKLPPSPPSSFEGYPMCTSVLEASWKLGSWRARPSTMPSGCPNRAAGRHASVHYLGVYDSWFNYIWTQSGVGWGNLGVTQSNALSYYWQPPNCALWPVNASRFARMMRGRVMHVVGDSIGQQTWMSLACVLSGVIDPGESTMNARANLTSHLSFYRPTATARTASQQPLDADIPGAFGLVGGGAVELMFNDCLNEASEGVFTWAGTSAPQSAVSCKTATFRDQVDWMARLLARPRNGADDVLVLNAGIHYSTYEETYFYNAHAFGVVINATFAWLREHFDGIIIWRGSYTAVTQATWCDQYDPATSRTANQYTCDGTADGCNCCNYGMPNAIAEQERIVRTAMAEHSLSQRAFFVDAQALLGVRCDRRDMIHFEMPSAADELVTWIYNLLLEKIG